MKKIICALLIFAFSFTVFACGPAIDDGASPKVALDSALGALGMADRGMVYLSETDNDFENLSDSLLYSFYKTDEDTPSMELLDSYALFKAYDAFGTEIGVYKTVSDGAAEKMEEFIKARHQRLKESATGEKEQKQISSFTVKKDGVWVYYVINENTVDAVKEIEKILY